MPQNSDTHIEMEMENRKNQALSRILSSTARQRLERIRMVSKDKAEYLEYILIHLASQNKLRIPMEDEDFKTFIMSNLASKRETIIKLQYQK
jgi:DNA-binding TFAR19-related protein (PDSD5 family)